MAKLDPIAQAKADVDKIKKRVTKLEKALSRGTKIGYVEGIKISQKSAKVTMILKKATTNVSKDIAVGEADGEIIMGKVEALIPCTTGALEKVTVLQPHFDKLKIAGIVKIVVNQLESAQSKFAAAMVEKAPTPALKAKGEAVRSTIDASFAKAVAAYSNAKGGEAEAAEAEKAAAANPDSDEDD